MDKSTFFKMTPSYTPEKRMLYLENQFWFEVGQIGDLGPVSNVLQDLIGLVEGVLGCEGFQKLHINISLDEIIKISNRFDL